MIVLAFTFLGLVPTVFGQDGESKKGAFVVAPYVQLGHEPGPGKLDLLWHANDVDADWSVEIQTSPTSPWRKSEKPSFRRIAVGGIAPHRVYRAALTDLPAGELFKYVVTQDAKPVFSAEARAVKSAKQAQRFVVFGDCGAGTPEQAPIAHHAMQAKPDFVMITGDIVYSRGQASEYRDKFWPYYNAVGKTGSIDGVPLLRSTLFLSSPGNHDIATRDLNRYPDALAYFYYWDQPLNGPQSTVGGPLVAPITGSDKNKQAFLDAAGPAFPRMANFSFDYGNAHWTVLDGNSSVVWADKDFQKWVADDLAAAKNATWRFVAFHQPGFNSSKAHFAEQYTRQMSPIFEKGNVDVVFTGHVHNYQRSHPLTFVPDADPVAARKGKGVLTLDKTYDGKKNTKPKGVIYLVTGAGGQHLYNPDQQDKPETWQEFTVNHISKVHSLTVADLNGKTLKIKQIDVEGREVDSFTITK
jgi:3',5'-cyclic AMP phosphodiesterase CpdA